MQSDAERFEELLYLLNQCKGNVAELARRLEVSRQAAGSRVTKAGLDEEAARLRAEHGISGTRSALMSGSVDPEGEREAIRAALREHKTQGAAARALGFHRRSLQRAMQRLGV